MHEKSEPPQSLGRRIAEQRQKLGWTQQELADRLAISRVAVSHLEASMTDPGERTVALLASVFKVEPHDLVAGTAYPPARAERLPVVVARYTEVEQLLALLEGDLRLVDHLPTPIAEGLLEQWRSRLGLLADITHDRREQAMVTEARARLRRWPIGS